MTMTNKTMKIALIILSLNLLFSVYSFSQKSLKTVIVIDESGAPIANASVVVGEGSEKISTNENGEFLMPAGTVLPIFIEADGFESQLIDACPLSLDSVELVIAPFHMGQKDEVTIPFGNISKRQISGAVTVLNAEEILKYDQTSIGGLINARIPGMFGTSSIRGMNDPLIVIDGIPRPASTLIVQEIEQITVLKDQASAMMYGSQAANGVILITTKRGKPLRKSINFTANNGFNKPIAYPKYLDAANYMGLFNEALANDGKIPKYSAEQIDNTRSGVDPVRYPDESYYNSTYLKDWTTYQNVVGEASGGNAVSQYYLNMGWNHDNGLVSLGDGAIEQSNRLNMRGNINYKLSDIISLKFDGAVVFNLSEAPRYTTEGEDFWTLSSTLHPEYYPVLIPSSLITDPALLGAARLVNGNSVLGGTSEHLTNMYGELTRNGIRKTNERLLQLNTGLDFDLASITKGLKASIFLSFDMNNMFQTDMLNTYAVYDPVYKSDTINKVYKYGVDENKGKQSVTLTNFYRRIGVYGTLDYKRSFGDHDIMVTGLAYRDQYSTDGALQEVIHLNIGVRANYMFKKKYVAELTGLMVGSSKLHETEPYAYSPGVGLGWILSEEGFLKDNSLINYLKIRANWAVNNNDESISSYYHGRNQYTQGSSYTYNLGQTFNRARIFTAGNSNLGWEKMMNINLGFESMFFDYKLSVEGTYFYNKSYDLLSQKSNVTPVYFASLPYQNYGSDQLQGVELGLNYRTNIGDVEIKFGGNLVYSTPKVLESDALNYPDEYQNRIGKPTDAIFGFVDLGMFKDQPDIDNSPYQTFGDVQPGDIKYKDLNGDNIIDDNDQEMIGNSGSRIGYGLTLNIKYKAFELFALGTGQSGQEKMFNNSYYWVYGETKYSEVVQDRWTTETATTAAYPRLSSSSNANNFTNSTFWMSKNNWFKLHTVQLTYTLQTISFAGLNEARFFARGHDLLTVSKIKDKTDLNIGRAPKTRGFSLGLTLLF